MDNKKKQKQEIKAMLSELCPMIAMAKQMLEMAEEGMGSVFIDTLIEELRKMKP